MKPFWRVTAFWWWVVMAWFRGTSRDPGQLAGVPRWHDSMTICSGTPAVWRAYHELGWRPWCLRIPNKGKSRIQFIRKHEIEIREFMSNKAAKSGSCAMTIGNKHPHKKSYTHV